MNSNRFKEIGVITKPHSYKGAVVIRLHSAPPEDYENSESLFLLVEGRAVPFMIESAELFRNDSLIVVFKGYESTERISEFVGCAVLAKDDGINSGKIPYQNLLTGFSLFDEDGSFRGTIISVSEAKYQWLATVRSDSGKTFLLPVHEDLIRSFDEKNKRVVMSIPGGIEDIG
jgi:16S rRNA processing protein RimM